jgi:hypothetical protein
MSSEVTVPVPCMHRFWLFAGRTCYPLGGMADFQGTYPSLEEAKESSAANLLRDYRGNRLEWWHIFDSETLEVVATSPGWEFDECDKEDLRANLGLSPGQAVVRGTPVEDVPSVTLFTEMGMKIDNPDTTERGR